METCKICSYEAHNKRSLATHLQSAHNLPTKEYTIQTDFNGVCPVCKNCGGEVRYVSFSFKKYCKNCSLVASSEAGKIGGKIKKTWNKGKTKKDDDRIMEYSVSYAGSGNPFYGKKHSQETMSNIRKASVLTEQEVLARLQKREDDFIFDFVYEEYISKQQHIRVICKKCGHQDQKSLVRLEKGSRCSKCYGLTSSTNQDTISLKPQPQGEK